MSHDLVLRGGRVLDPSQGIDRVADLAFAGGRIAAVGEGLEGRDTRDAQGLLVVPGLIDLHTHVYWGGTSLGIDADAFRRRCGVTTAVDTGSAGPGNFAGFRAHVIERARTRILAYLHVSFAGIWGFDRRIMVGESEDLRLMAPREAVAVARENRGVVVGIKVRVGRHASGVHGLAPLDVALQAAEEAGLPLMAHIDEPPPTYEQVLARLRPGDVLTHAFRPFPNTGLTPEGRVREAAREARRRGVLFDIGHGMGSFAFAVGRRMLEEGFPPDVISSDIHRLCWDGPVFDQTTTLSKFLALGMSLPEVIRATTAAPAAALGRADLGAFRRGAAGDATLLRLDEGRFPLVDAVGETLVAERRLVAMGAVLGGTYEDCLAG